MTTLPPAAADAAPPTPTPQPPSVFPRLLAGFIAATATIAISLGLRLSLGLSSPIEKLYSELTHFLGTPAMFQLVHKLLGFGEAGKIAAFLGTVAASLVALTLLGLAPALPAAGVVLLAGLVLLGPLSSAGWIGSLIAAGVYLGLRLALASLTQPASDSQGNAGRRQTLGILGGVAGFTLGAGGFGFIQPLLAPVAKPKALAEAGAGASKLPMGVTPQADLYYVSINNEALDPKLKEAGWQLELKGMVKTPQVLKLADIKAMPSREMEHTMSCISNPVGGGLIGNVIWTGISLKTLLEQAGIQSGAKWITWRAADGFYESLPLGQALEDDVMLAYGINGEALSQKHGFPLRVILPGHYGMKQPRWLTEIELTATEKPGYWAERGWSRTAYVQTSSRIDTPESLASFAPKAKVPVRGVAHAGSEEITKVELSFDGGKTWREVERLPRRSRHSWTLWQYDWVAEAGNHELVVRAYTAKGVQNSTERDSLPEAASGLHKVTLLVV
jgi:DMSO/TMAO reductase YedYZ molybdopterin-dependent catalytic subunit